MGILPDVKLIVLNVNLDFSNRTKKKKQGVVSEQTSIFLHGAEGSGKTTMLERATGKKVEELELITRTLGEGVDTHLLETKDGLSLVADHSGEQSNESMVSRLRALNTMKPLAILFLLDHAPRDHDNDPAYKCPSGRELPEDSAHPVRHRFEEHKRAIEELEMIFRASPSLGERCKIVLPIINKRDSWKALGYDTGIFLDWYFYPLTSLTRSIAPYSVKLLKPIPFSGKWEDFTALDVISKEAGKEWVIKFAENPLFNLVFRIPKVKKS